MSSTRPRTSDSLLSGTGSQTRFKTASGYFRISKTLISDVLSAKRSRDHKDVDLLFHVLGDDVYNRTVTKAIHPMRASCVLNEELRQLDGAETYGK